MHPQVVIQLSEQQVIDQIAQRLSEAYTAVATETVGRVVRDKHADFQGRPVRDFIPLFVERRARAELATLNT
jgi:hypothetical protein